MPIALPNDSTETLALALPNDSTLTLVPPPASFTTVLALSADSVLNTTFAARGVPLYRLKTVGTSTRTDVTRCGAEDALVASLDRRLLGDVIIRPGGEKVKVGKWSKTVGKKAAAASGYDQIAPPMIFTSGEEIYVWVVNVAGHMACFRRGAASPTPLAWFEPSKSVHSGSATASGASMSLAADAEDDALRTDIILAWMIFAERVRARAKTAAAGQFQGMQMRPG